MKKFLIHSLLRLYSMITICILLLIAGVISVNNMQSYLRDVEKMQVDVATQLESDANRMYHMASEEIYDIFHNEVRLEGVYKYFEMSPADYAKWNLDQTDIWFANPSLHQNIIDIYRRNDFIKGIDIALTSEDSVFVSTNLMKSGKQISAKDYRKPKNAFSIAVHSQQNFDVMAIVYITVDASYFENLVMDRTDLPVYINIRLNDSPFFSMNSAKNTLLHEQNLGNRSRVQIGVKKSAIRMDMLKLVGGILCLSLIVGILLLLILQRVFANYGNQVSDLVETMQNITSRDRDLRINLDHKRRELLTISTNINEMLDYLEESSREIYTLEIAQQEANLRALQSQINPHFLYNTLEFFRMYAVTHDQDELGDMIYEFSTLMRNSISQEKTTTIQRELEFCEKFSYICQLRFPKSIAYSYQVSADCRDVEIPKFALQPLIENFFVHGIDYKKKSNAISVKVYREQSGVCILIRDNGKGMSAETMAEYQEMVAKDIYRETSSVGIQNIHQRLRLYFKDAYKMEISNSPFGGLTYLIRIEGV
ncbi:sensor histidine kinase [Streptococcus gallolyticus]|uniref:sensor histidine kinase n=1 Tax=Streptococcus hepaticus TaxID=3349163 RepID=UPI001C960C4D|nr:sensor histidine kinase [Streptococcus gallolyticus]MBY5041254.1 sensor histidine kinase [Streptococcus gallolyticus]